MTERRTTASTDAHPRSMLGAVVVALALVLAACGGDDDAGDGAAATTERPATGATTTVGDPPDTPDTPDTTAPAAVGTPEVDGIGVASVTFDGESYLFGDPGRPGLQCRANYLGVFLLVLTEIDEAGNAVPQGAVFELTLLHDGTDPDVIGQLPAAGLSVRARDESWIADETFADTVAGVEPGSSQIDEYVIDGNTATGTATFIERYTASSAPRVAQGTFEATCSDDG